MRAAVLHEAPGDLVLADLAIASPIGRAVMGKEEGDEILVPTPNGTREFDLVKLVTMHGE